VRARPNRKGQPVNASRVHLEPHESQVRVARRHLHEACREMHRDLVEVAVLLVSELVTNAIRHGQGAVGLVIKKFPSRLCVEVTDDGPGLPSARAPHNHHAGGRGLILVERLATEWGVTPLARRPGKTVWFTLRSA